MRSLPYGCLVFQARSVTLTVGKDKYSHVNTNGGVVDCKWYSVFHILLDLCEAVWETETCNQNSFI